MPVPTVVLLCFPMSMMTISERVCTRYAKATLVTYDVGPFVVETLPQHAEFDPILRDALAKTEDLYARAGLPLKGKIRIEVRGKGWRQRSYFTPNENFIGILPQNLRTHDALQLFIHEVAHWYHWNIIPGGFANRTIKQKFNEVKKAPNTGGSAFERLEDEIKLKQKELAQLQKGVPKGTIAEVSEWEDPFKHGEKYVRKYKIIKPADRTGRETMCELLNPSPWDQSLIDSQGWKPPHLRKVFTQYLLEALGLDQQVKGLRRDLEALMGKQNALADSKDTTKYQDLRSEWVPTDYAKTNSMEFFAELVTTVVLNPPSLSPAVKDWLDQIR